MYAGLCLGGRDAAELMTKRRCPRWPGSR
jgi:hypothetical protein